MHKILKLISEIDIG